MRDNSPLERVAASAIPGPSEKRIALRVTPAAERALRAGHPWLFDQAIQQQSHEGKPGDLAVVFDRKSRFLAVGLYDPHSPIRARVLQQGQPAAIDRNWFQSKVAAAADLRQPLSRQSDTTGYRLVHGENDGLPGLVIDRYDQTFVLKLYTAAWLPHLKNVLPALLAIAPAERLLLRLSRAVQSQTESLYGLANGQLLLGPALEGSLLFQENGLTFEVDPVQGQKTGFFLDQRENRARVEGLAAGQRVLNVFAYTGGFSLYAARGGAQSVTSLDISRPALAAARRNFALNQENAAIAAADHETVAGDAFQVLGHFHEQGQLFDQVIVDPPAFAKSQAEVERALSAYAHLTGLSLALLRPGGILVMASCSSRVSAEDFFATVNRAAANVGRPLQEIERTGHPLDHPVGFVEGAYLKCLFAVVL